MARRVYFYLERETINKTPGGRDAFRSFAMDLSYPALADFMDLSEIDIIPPPAIPNLVTPRHFADFLDWPLERVANPDFSIETHSPDEDILFEADKATIDKMDTLFADDYKASFFQAADWALRASYSLFQNSPQDTEKYEFKVSVDRHVRHDKPDGKSEYILRFTNGAMILVDPTVPEKEVVLSHPGKSIRDIRYPREWEASSQLYGMPFHFFKIEKVGRLKRSSSPYSRFYISADGNGVHINTQISGKGVNLKINSSLARLTRQMQAYLPTSPEVTLLPLLLERFW